MYVFDSPLKQNTTVAHTYTHASARERERALDDCQVYKDAKKFLQWHNKIFRESGTVQMSMIFQAITF